jgi:serine/threonine-protein kinase
MLVVVSELPRLEPGLMVTSNVRLVRPLGEGGMGSVWVAEHLSLRTSVVVKFMAKELVDSPDAIARFSREAAAASQVKSPHVVQMLDHGFIDGGAPYIVMELLEGKDLERHIKEGGGKLPPREVVAIVLQLARALGKAHERGIVHRDIKPSNVFLLDAGGGELFVKLLDFGIAKGSSLGIQGSTTRSGTFVGSPFYMSPEQVVGAKDVDFRSDLWSLGVLAFEALTGQKPFVAETLGALALKIHRDPLPMPTTFSNELPAAIDAWFTRACAREPGERFASARETAESLAAALLGEGATTPLSDSGAKSPKPTSRSPEARKAPEPHGLAATLRSEGPTGSVPAGGLARTAKWLAPALVAAGLVGTLLVAKGFAVDGGAREAKAQGASIAESVPSGPVAPTPSAAPLALTPSVAPAPSPLPAPSPSLAPIPPLAAQSSRRSPPATSRPKGTPSARPSDDDIK